MRNLILSKPQVAVSFCDEEKELWEKLRFDEELATVSNEELNLLFAVSKQYHSKNGLPLVEILNAGKAGLLRAKLRLPKTMKTDKYRSFLIWAVRQAVLERVV